MHTKEYDTCLDIFSISSVRLNMSVIVRQFPVPETVCLRTMSIIFLWPSITEIWCLKIYCARSAIMPRIIRSMNGHDLLQAMGYAELVEVLCPSNV